MVKVTTLMERLPKVVFGCKIARLKNGNDDMTEVTDKKKLKPARKQVPEDFQVNRQEQQSGQVYNLWYHKWAGGDNIDPYANKTKSQTRLNVKKDSGYTRADSTEHPFVCLFWARGCCPYGHECNYLHRRSLPSDKFDYSTDLFGRSKHDAYRDDMGGVGSFSRINRTIYVGRIQARENIDKIVHKHFKEFGRIEKIKILIARGVAFVTYFSDRDAELAKEAMMNQSLDNDEILNVRWATEDPNEAAKIAEAARIKAMGVDTVAQKMPHAYREAILSVDALQAQSRQLIEDEEPVDKDQPETKRLRLMNDSDNNDMNDSDKNDMKAPEPIEMTEEDIEWQLQEIENYQAHLEREEQEYEVEVNRQKAEQQEESADHELTSQLSSNPVVPKTSPQASELENEKDIPTGEDKEDE